jgi:hypothetical protein
MNKWLSVAALVVLCLSLVIFPACGGGEEEDEEGVTELKFGFGLPVAGTVGAIMGMPAKYAFKIAVERIGVFEVAGKQYRWKPIFEDNLFTVAGGVASATKLLYEHNVDYMHQAGIDPGMSAADLCEGVGMILDVAGGNWDAFGPERPHMFQVAATWALGYATFFDWLTKEHPEVERVASVFSDDNMGHQEADAVKACCGLMPWDPDLVITVLGTAVVDIMWEMGYEGLTMTSYWLEAHGEDKGWDRCKGHLIIMPHPLGDPWPESAALAEEFEDRYGMELVPAAWWTFMVVSVMTDVLKQAGTVDDTDKIIETMESRAGFETQAGPLYYGLQELNGIGHVAIWPSPIYEIVGDHEYRVITVYTPEETEALAIEIFKK